MITPVLEWFRAKRIKLQTWPPAPGVCRHTDDLRLLVWFLGVLTLLLDCILAKMNQGFFFIVIRTPPNVDIIAPFWSNFIYIFPEFQIRPEMQICLNLGAQSQLFSLLHLSSFWFLSFLASIQSWEHHSLCIIPSIRMPEETSFYNLYDGTLLYSRVAEASTTFPTTATKLYPDCAWIQTVTSNPEPFLAMTLCSTLQPLQSISI